MPPAVRWALLALALWSSPAAAAAIPIPPQEAMFIDDPHHYFRAASVGVAGAGAEAAPEARALGFGLGFGLGLGAPASYAHSVAKRVRSRTSYQTSAMAAPRVTGCEAVCALQRRRDAWSDA